MSKPSFPWAPAQVPKQNPGPNMPPFFNPKPPGGNPQPADSYPAFPGAPVKPGPSGAYPSGFQPGKPVTPTPQQSNSQAPKFGPGQSAPKASAGPKPLSPQEQKLKADLDQETVQRVVIDTDKEKRKQEILVNFDYEIQSSFTVIKTEGETSLEQLRLKHGEISAKKKEIEQVKQQIKTEMQRLQQQPFGGLTNNFEALGKELQDTSTAFTEKVDGLSSQLTAALNNDFQFVLERFQASQSSVDAKFTEVSDKLQQTKQKLSGY